MGDLAQGKAIVLQCIEYKESDLIVKLLSSDGALFIATARAAKNSKKRFGGAALEPLNYIQYHAKHLPTQDRWTLTEASVVDGFESLRLNYDALMCAFKMARLVLFVSQESLEDPSLFHLMGNSLKTLQKEGTKPELCYWHFVCRLLAGIGDLEPIPLLNPMLKNSIGFLEDKTYTEKDWKELTNYLRTKFQTLYHKDLESV